MRSQSQQYQISEIKQDRSKLFLDWADSHRSTFHYIWLRDNCYCPLCGDPRHGEKRFKIIDFPLDIEPLSVRWDRETLEIVWKPDGHQSIYDAQWLRQHCYSATERKHRQHRPILWDSNIVTNLPQIAYEEVQTGDKRRLQLLKHLRDYGICFVRNVPTQKGELESFAQSFGPLLETNYGRVFEIVVDPEESQKSVANSQINLIPHTDDAYQYAPPGIIFFHCLIANNDGSGQSTFVDGFKIAEVLRQQDGWGFDLLCRYEVSFRKYYSDRIDMRFSSPLFCLDSGGNLKEVRISNLFPAPLDLPEEIIEPFYAAYRKLMQLYTDPRYCLKQGLQPGDLVMFDNHRVLHGRTAIGINNQRRHLRYCSVDRDYFQSWRRLVEKNLSFQG
ncbi:TauD/TfdA family dioxygenase [Moorena producens JHB]|uniref:TauD/TfdA family dioxygenase n=1 Tax=Moorena producens (strain JHB) TaxID=1454205 RepID=A0A1D9G145_MOOP1|nr:TauD/TfdA family dioxygenase [Moorena producens]AOY81281.1 TauD/TfdA family dioxygenase [Moorena producens JHB]